MASRFTLDSATEFLFGKDVHSLSAGFPYPSSSRLSQPSSSVNHSSNTFSQAFGEGQDRIAFRSRYGMHWPLREFWVDVVKKLRTIVDEFIDPILNEALAKNKAAKDASGEIKGITSVRDDETLLDHLVNFTDGECQSSKIDYHKLIVCRPRDTQR
jgi:hypothetical protein